MRIAQTIGGPSSGLAGEITAFAEEAAYSIYVDGYDGDDTNPGTQILPVATIAAANSLISTISAANPSKIIQMLIHPGTYSEDLIIEDTNFTNLEIKAINDSGYSGGEGMTGKSSVIVDNLRSNQDNENLAYLRIKGIEVTGTTSLVCDIDGASNLFGSGYIHLQDCRLLGATLTIGAIGKISIDGTQILCDTTVTNVRLVEFFNVLNQYNTITMISDGTGNEPSSYTSSIMRCRFSSHGEVSSTRVNGSTANLQVELYVGSRIAGAHTIGTGTTLTLNQGSYTWGAAGAEIQAGATLFLVGGWWYPGWTIDPAATIYFYDTGFGETVAGSNTVYVDGSLGNDRFNGSLKYPYATIAAAVARAVTLQTSSPTEIIEIVIAQGTYSEDITLENANLRKLYIRAELQQNLAHTPATDLTIENCVTNVTANSLQSTANNDDLRYLVVEGIKFTNTNELSTSATGVSNHFCIDKCVLKNCVFETNLTFTSGSKCFLENSYFEDDLIVLNAAYLYLADTICEGNVTVDWDSTAAIPQRYDGDAATGMNVIMPPGDVQTLGYWDVNTNGGWISFNVSGTFLPFTFDMGTGVYLFLKPGGYVKCLVADAETWASGSAIYLNGGTYYEKSTRTNNASTTYFENAPTRVDSRYFEHAILTTAENNDIDTGTETIDSFADTLGSSVTWTYVISKGANLRSGIINACWDATGDTIEKMIMSTNDVGDTSPVSLDVDISSNTVRLRATATSDDWTMKVVRTLLI